ncbi:STM4014 family protein [Streptomyces sp. NPDC057301]|uniref:STM4014 family protein n=1 Tax=Streptomyces sp. NPDC057301 TaxID=3346093 RepID=UPI003638CD58
MTSAPVTATPATPAPVLPATALAIVGNPGHRRVTLFQAALRSAGLPPARVVPWAEVLTGMARFRPGEAVRIDSPGEDTYVDGLLRGVSDSTRVEGGARWYASFLAAVDRVAVEVRAAGGTLLGEPAELAVLFDKRLCHAALAAVDVPVPPSPTSGAGAPPVRGWPDVRELLGEPGLRRIFVKPAHGSSASGVLAVESAPGGRLRATTSVERTPSGALHNSLRLRVHEDEATIGALVDALAPDGLHVERWLPKASLAGRSADLRVVVAGRATHAVVRTAAGPITNLHLGGRRGDLDAVRAAVSLAGGDWPTALRICERAAAAFPGTPCVGVDLLPAVGWRRFAVGEVNAFGDLLPGLTGLPGGPAEGLDTYAAQVAALTGARPGSLPPSPIRPGRPPRASSGRDRTTVTTRP